MRYNPIEKLDVVRIRRRQLVVERRPDLRPDRRQLRLQRLGFLLRAVGVDDHRFEIRDQRLQRRLQPLQRALVILHQPDERQRRDFRASPLLAEDLSRLPPALIHTAEFDPFRDEAEAYGEALLAAGVHIDAVRHPGMIHYFYALSQMIPYGAQAVEAMGAEIRAAFARR